MTELFTGMLHGLLAMGGMGSVYDPLGDKRAEMSHNVSSFNSMTAEFSYRAAIQNNKRFHAFEELMKANGEVARKQLEFTSQMIWDTLETENLFIIFLYMLILIIIIYLLLKK